MYVAFFSHFWGKLWKNLSNNCNEIIRAIRFMFITITKGKVVLFQYGGRVGKGSTSLRGERAM